MAEIFYKDLLNKYQIIRSKLKHQLVLLSYSRLLVFVLFILTCYKYFSSYEIVFILLSISLIIIFLAFLLLVQKLNKKLLYYNNLIDININELNCLSGDYSKNNDGQNFVKLVNGSFATDLDVIGNNSQLVRASSSYPMSKASKIKLQS